ncbi:MAG: DNA-formamidopyrimidine glycosylase family protein [Myxococcota bacterium]
MPELPDVTVYVEMLQDKLIGQRLQDIKLRSVSLLRTFDPPHREAYGMRVVGVQRQAKRIVLAFEDDLYFVIHLMRLGRFRWADTGKKAKNAGGKVLHAVFTFESGTLHLVEMGPKKRASLHVVRGAEAVAEHDRGGLEVFEINLDAFAQRLRRKNHTLKRAMTDPRIFAGIGNAYSDEILHAAKLSPIKLSQKLDDDEVERLYQATQATLAMWTDRLREEGAERGWLEKVTAFRPDMAVHGKHGEPCPVCGAKVQRIKYADRETNYCAVCQTGGRPLADRALSRFLGKDWPKTLEELEERRSPKA